VPLSALTGVHRRIEQALTENAIDAELRPYFDGLKEQSTADGIFAGFRLIRREAEPGGNGAEPPEAAGRQVRPILRSSAREWKRPSRTGRAWMFSTGFSSARRPRMPPAPVRASSRGRRLPGPAGRHTCFRMPPAEESSRSQDASRDPFRVDAAVHRLNRGIALLNFHREPIYLPDDSLELQPRFRRYAIAARKIPVLRELRNQFLGRAIHTTPEAWRKQLQALLVESLTFYGRGRTARAQQQALLQYEKGVSNEPGYRLPSFSNRNRKDTAISSWQSGGRASIAAGLLLVVA